MIEAMLMQLQLRWYVYQTIILTVHQRNVTAAQAAHVYPGLYIYKDGLRMNVKACDIAICNWIPQYETERISAPLISKLHSLPTYKMIGLVKAEPCSMTYRYH